VEKINQTTNINLSDNNNRKQK